MGDVVKIDDYRKSQALEEEYLKFLSHVNKFVKTPTDIVELAKCFYFTLRYLEGNINCLEVLSLMNRVQSDQTVEMKNHVVQWMDRLTEDLKL